MAAASPRSRTSSAELLSPPAAHPSRQTTPPTAVFNLVSTMIGGGCLSLPYAFARAGVLVGVLVLSTSAVLSAFSVYVLMACARRTGASSFREVAFKAYGTPLEAATILMIFLLTFLSIVAYMVLSMQNVVSVLEAFLARDLSLTEMRNVLLLTMAAVLPFTLQRSLHALRFTCFVSFFSVVVLAFAIGYRCLEGYLVDPGQFAGASWVGTDPRGALAAVPLCSVAFLCHFNALPVHGALAKPTRQRLKVVVRTAIGAATLVYLAIAIFGYGYAQGETSDNILLNFDPNDSLMMLGRVGLTLTVLLGMPLLMLPCRKALLDLCRLSGRVRLIVASTEEERRRLVARTAIQATPHPSRSRSRSRTSSGSGSVAVDSSGTSTTTGEVSTPVHAATTLGIFAAAVGVALNVPGVAVVWNVVGSSVAICIAYIIPGACYLKIRAAKPRSVRKLACWVLVVGGAIVSVVCTTMAFTAVVRDAQDGRDSPMRHASDAQ